MRTRTYRLATAVIVGLAICAVNALSQHPAQVPKKPDLARFEFEEPHMGTKFRIVLYAADEALAKKAAKAAFARIAELNRVFSDYDDASELMTLCKKSGTLPTSVSEDLFAILAKSDEVFRLSGGAFDVTAGPAVRLWRRARRTLELPREEERKQALAKVGFANVRLDAMRRAVQLLAEGILLDLGGIAKGYAAEAALATLRRFEIRHALIAAGGDVSVSDAPPGTPGWKIAVETPGEKGDTYIYLRNAAVSTSGDANQFATIGGKRYSHIVDPKTGVGLVGRRSATVIAKSGTLADALATAVCVMGPDRGLKLIESRDDLAALYVGENAAGELEVRTSTRFAKHVVKK